VIKLQELIKEDCHCGESCCSTKESVNESVDDLKKIVGELEKASKLHAGQSQALAKASKMHASQAKRIQSHLSDMDESLSEGPQDQRPADKEVQRLIKLEAQLRNRMMKLEQIFLRDGNPPSVKLAKDLTKSYKQNVTKFMREMISIRKKFK
jgi:septal ring factor EnvC (AmiA/AmiB activator)|tara:strand:- start:62 stop:517 length:456 start_codon:yes stop_codon:yes gene_type:complete